MWSSLQFLNHLEPLYEQYKTDNRWVSWWTNPQTDILNSWRLYRAAYQSSVGFLLLGDTKIRKDPALVMNFGLSSAGGVQDPPEVRLVEELQRKRGLVPADRNAPRVVGVGSILSDKNWTPMLNDSFVLGGIHRGQQFHLAEDEAHRFMNRPTSGPQTIGREALEQRRAVFGAAVRFQPGAEAVYRAWKEFFRANPTQFWGPWGPRVFAREVLGLRAFGYHPVFKEQALIFTTASPGTSSQATFSEYLNTLRSVNFQVPDRAAILTAIRQYLFFDETGNLWP